jgi:16S rRNA (guanine527-N7)-methyltransferase
MVARTGAVDIDAAIATLTTRLGLPGDARPRLARFVDLLLHDPAAPTSIRTPQAAIDDHIADSLSGLECESLRSARSIIDLGSGAGLPGLPLAIALPNAEVVLLESAGRKVKFLVRAIESCQVKNAEVVHARAETFATHASPYDAVSARAVAPLPVVLEYAAPLLRVGGTVVVWRGRAEPELEAAARHAAAELGLGEPMMRPVHPHPRVQHRHLYAVRKVAGTPSRYPRRPGMALKRPLGMGRRVDTPSDRIRR